MAQGHSVTSGTPVTAERAEYIARVMSALGTASRVRILGRLREGPCNVGELARAVEMAQPAVSQQLRLLRDLGLVVGMRTGRSTTYSLYDSHVAMLLDESLRHIEHLATGTPDTIWPILAPPDNGTTGATMTEDHTHQTPHVHEHGH